MGKLKKFFKLTFLDKILVLSNSFQKFLVNKMNFSEKYTLRVDNKKNLDNLVIIVAGYQEYTRNCIFERIKKYMDIPADVIIVSCGKFCKELKTIAEKNNWSYLSTKENRIALGQNIAIKIHKNAKFIYKLDGDIFVTKGLFKNLRDKYDYSIRESQFYPGGITPVININLFTYINFLESIGKMDEFKQMFDIKVPKQKSENKKSNIWYSGDVAQYVWENTLPIDRTQENFFKNINIQQQYITNSVRYSIGCFMFPRHIREEMGGFQVTIEKGLGVEEAEYLNFCTNNSFPIILCENSLVGHLSFGPQKANMEKFFKENERLFYS